MESVGEGSLRALVASVLIGIVIFGPGDVAASCLRGWCGTVGVTLEGFNHSVRRTDTQGLCHGACSAEPRCRAVNYELETGMCHLVFNASHLSEPGRLVARPGWFYSYIDAEPSDGLFTAQNHETPSFENHFNAGPEFVRTTEAFPSANLSLARHACSRYGMQLCTLAQMRAAYDAGFADFRWSLINMEGRDARMTPCYKKYVAQRECYDVVDGSPDESLIPNTPRPAVTNEAYCCADNQTLEWRLVFRGVGGQMKANRSLFEIWTDRHWDATLVDEGLYRDQTIYEAWHRDSSQLQLVKLSLFNTDEAQPAAQLIFSGVHSNITNWFCMERHMASHWLDLSIAPTGSIAIDSQFWPGRHFLIDRGTVGCTGDEGWLFVAGSKPTCSWVEPYAIMHSNTKRSVTWSARSDGGVGVADFMTIHVLWSEAQ